jgi:hypothetical protein
VLFFVLQRIQLATIIPTLYETNLHVAESPMHNTTTMDLIETHAARHGFGLPDARLARVAARRAFVEMKICFMRAAAQVEGSKALELQRQVRLALEITDLWRLRGALFDALPQESHGDVHREEMRQHLESGFHDSDSPLDCTVSSAYATTLAAPLN